MGQVPADLPPELARVHLIGMGGAGMSGIARLLLARGGIVSGSDARDSRVLAALRQVGATVFVGHDAAHLGAVGGGPEPATVVTSTAIRATNPELVEAHRLGLSVLPRAAALAALMKGRKGVAIAGTHGKTTTTSMLTVALQDAGLHPSFAIGGDLSEPGSNAHAGSGDIFVAEADESDGSFLLLAPYGAIVTNVEPDHLDHYADAAAVDRAFDRFLERIDPAGFLVACLDDPGAARLLPLARSRGVRAVSYGTAADADVRIDKLRTGDGGAGVSYQAVSRGRRLGEVTLQVPGAHNARNSAAVLAAGLQLGVPAPNLLHGLAGYPGVRRRFELKGRAQGVTVIDDYGHHPTEVAATLSAARPVAGTGRLLVAFQPHRYSRTAAFGREFGEALGLADVIVVMDVYPAGEDPIPGISGQTIVDAVPPPVDRVVYEPTWARVPALLAALARPGDLLLTMGAGDVTLLGPEVLRELTEA
ncbi:MAG TPA: UDP-N-acetylmuramate--L-alanine ligase [Frankiaceae bacterium]|jgi:UDP-N-acetylmuramate--alanine ligase|nr:UDP-N-acetylmuramate--L-alanine ligase [Frankiaceae bacterium]